MTAASRKLRVGVLVNPIAGVGGRWALKGSDDRDRIVELAAQQRWSDEVHSFARGVAFVKQLDRTKVVIVTAPGVMGEDVVKRGTLFGGPVFEIARVAGWNVPFGHTGAQDTIEFARRLRAADIDVLAFVGGDGTAVDVARAVGRDLPVVGVPAGVKMFSPVFAQTPEFAAAILNGLSPGFPTQEADVLDLDEESYRTGAWIVRAQEAVLVPQAEGIQIGKGMAAASEDEAAQDLVAWFQRQRAAGTSYVLGSGTTVGAIKKSLGGGSPLGVDVWRDGSFAAVDATEEQILEALGEEGPARIIVSPTGGQGAVLGRGTAQIGPTVLDRVGVENVTVVATPGKLLGLSALFVDTGDPELDRSFPDYIKVRTDPSTEKVFPLRKGIQLVR